MENDDESIFSKGEQQTDAESAAGEAGIDNEEEHDLTDSHENDAHVGSPADHGHKGTWVVSNHQAKATEQGTRRSTFALHCDDLLAGNCV